MTLKARVKAGRLVVDEPTDLPEGTEIELLPLDPGDWLDEEDRAALHKALRDSEEDVKAGRLAEVFVEELEQALKVVAVLPGAPSMTTSSSCAEQHNQLSTLGRPMRSLALK
jgi:hypothetical protein